MHPALAQLHKVLQLEVNAGYPNRAVIGGLPKMLGFWKPNAERTGIDPTFIRAVEELLRAYPDQGPTERSATVSALFTLLREAAAAAPPRPGSSQARAVRPETARQPAAPETASPPPQPAATRPEAASAGRPSPSGPAAPPSTTGAPAQAAQSQTPTPTYSAPDSLPQQPAPAAASGTPAAPRQTAAHEPAHQHPQAPPAAAPNAAREQPPARQQPKAGRGRPQKPGGAPAQRMRRDVIDSGEEPLEPRPRRAVSPRPLRSATPVDVAAGIDAPLTVLYGVGPETAAQFARLGIKTLRDLLLHFPRRYDDYSRMKTINRLEPDEECTVIGTVREATVRPMRGRPGSMIKVIISDSTGELELTFFNQPHLTKQLVPGRQIVASGRVRQYLGHITMQPREWEDLDRELLSTGRIVPVYPASTQIRPRQIRKLTTQVVHYWAPKQPDPLPAALVERAGLMPYAEALSQVHFPDSQEKLAAARHRLAFDELLLLQLGVLRQRQAWQSVAGQVLQVDDSAHQAFIASLPYPLTNAQQRAVAQIRSDLARNVPMNRLLQGDVGSGKTAVAAAAMAVTVQAGAQAAIMAPTSILAEQHFNTLAALLAPVIGGPAAIRLLQGATSAFEKAAIYEGLRTGEVKVVVGTHAIIEDPVDFANLGLVVVDEQHRFGVAQRAALRSKGANPHLLVMTATPIPRSLALTVYGDLDLTVLDEMPPGRKPIQTYLVKAKERERGYGFIRSQVVKGRQAFVIFPLVEESDKIEARAAVAEHERLQRDVFRDFRLGLLHGRMKPDEKDEVMARFRAGEYHILVSTSVVEVGVDVPNATVILIEGANRFGLAQLHQFRGRVGRGEHASFCLLVNDSGKAHSEERLQAMVESQDGFYLAEKDLDLRGPGDFLGTRQSGFAGLHMARLTDLSTIEQARREARQLFEKDPGLQAPDHQLLARRLEEFWTPGDTDAS
jgi:ATP-dependent DNA helicase RecG